MKMTKSMFTGFTFRGEGGSAQKDQRFTFYLDIELCTQSLRVRVIGQKSQSQTQSDGHRSKVPSQVLNRGILLTLISTKGQKGNVAHCTLVCNIPLLPLGILQAVNRLLIWSVWFYLIITNIVNFIFNSVYSIYIFLEEDLRVIIEIRMMKWTR